MLARTRARALGPHRVGPVADRRLPADV